MSVRCFVWTAAYPRLYRATSSKDEIRDQGLMDEWMDGFRQASNARRDVSLATDDDDAGRCVRCLETLNTASCRPTPLMMRTMVLQLLMLRLLLLLLL